MTEQMTEQAEMVLDVLSARWMARNTRGADMAVSAEELSRILELAEEASAGPWTTEDGHSGDNWLVAFCGRDADTNIDKYVTTDRIHLSEKGGNPEADSAFIAYLHPIRALRLVAEIERLRLEVANG